MLSCNSCQKVITTRRVCGGDRICVSKWLALLLVIVFIGVLFARCRTARACDTPYTTVNQTVSYAQTATP